MFHNQKCLKCSVLKCLKCSGQVTKLSTAFPEPPDTKQPMEGVVRSTAFNPLQRQHHLYCNPWHLGLRNWTVSLPGWKWAGLPQSYCPHLHLTPTHSHCRNRKWGVLRLGLNPWKAAGPDGVPSKWSRHVLTSLLRSLQRSLTSACQKPSYHPV